MKKLLFQKVLCIILSVTTLFSLVAFTTSAATSQDREYGSNRDTASSLEEMEALVGIPTYEEYLAEYGDPDSLSQNLPTITVDIKNIISGSDGKLVSESDKCQDAMKEDPANWKDFGDNQNNSIYLSSQGTTTWNFEVPEGASGYYQIKLVYFSCITSESSISTIERKLFIDGVAPFKEGSYFTLNKLWGYTNISTTEPEATTEPDGATTEYKQLKDAYCKVVTVIKDGYKTVTTYSLSQDINGNSMSPGIEQSPSWSTYFCQDSTGYNNGYLNFYLAEGGHQLTFAAEREPLIIQSIELVPYSSASNVLPSYESVKEMYAQNGYKPADGEITVIQAEFPDYVSDASVYPSNDKTSSANYPLSPKSQLYNVIGKNSYNALGQWAAYKFRVSDTGLYKISMRYLQSMLQGMYLCRAFRISGGIYGLEDGTPTVPFAEAYDAQFVYNKNWQSKFVSDSNGNEFEFYFEEGVEYTLYVDCSLGSLQNLIQRAENVLNTINDYYLRILQLTGAAPDEYRDYGFLAIMPDVLRGFGVQAKELEDIRVELKELCGTNGSHIATLGTIALLLDEMSRNDGYNVASNMSNLKNYLGTLGTWINDSKKGTLLIDSISICPSDTAKGELPAAKANFFKSAWFEITSFFYSFFTDYDKMGVTETNIDTDVSIDVWLALGRDQSNIWRTMIDAQDGFTAQTGYAVNLKLVTAGTLLPSILSGKGPDVYMGLGAADVINYAIRDAILGISGNIPIENYNNEIFNNTYYTYEGDGKPTTEYRGEEGLTFVSYPFKEYVNANFVQAAMDTVTLLDVTYALPQTMDFSMMFYRMDVLAELGLEVPETWEDLLSMLPVFQSNNMEIGVSYVLALDFMLYQKGGNMWKYTDVPEYAGSKINLDSDIALESFEYVCRLFSDYSFPISFDAANRFRTGEMPLLIGSYQDFYNKIVVYATEIEGLWEFCPLPGCATYDEAGNRTSINYDSLATITATVMLHGCEGEEQLAAWEFMQWETSSDVQSEYGNKLVSILGPSGKYEAANINAIQNLSWTANEKKAILDQIEHMSSIVNYPGSYIYSRYLKFAFLDAVNDGADPVDALSSYIDAINAEITRKREEFGLKTGDPS
ncbi:MAG: extracellular solute-binding protein [Ruminococcaceae bacterium]|nr:extracellular solute-binding protein [Oscillospiraceae bacterium]